MPDSIILRRDIKSEVPDEPDHAGVFGSMRIRGAAC
jgi:hypothetical protein